MKMLMLIINANNHVLGVKQHCYVSPAFKMNIQNAVLDNKDNLWWWLWSRWPYFKGAKFFGGFVPLWGTVDLVIIFDNLSLDLENLTAGATEDFQTVGKQLHLPTHMGCLKATIF